MLGLSVHLLTHILDGQVTGLSRLPHGVVTYLYEHGSTELCAHQVSDPEANAACKMKFLRARHILTKQFLTL